MISKTMPKRTNRQTKGKLHRDHGVPARSEIPRGPEWSYEIKLDGYRLEAVKNAGEVTPVFPTPKYPQSQVRIYRRRVEETS